ncbi:unnamed protein product [Rotaria sordida]|uniref:PIN domain-containing protein n=1 Tax=Rotaria sordida TaxID=392033 RepID=A0A813V0T5_9BILA|nr:unnamed protein product [Rotaria sordida]CAF0882666.1 unnamed protein product [Rotaria sordida]CAF1027198.1 unnamed protein product [Rotaria sordida]CAF3578649.1 unnamed protein product [Rotaria sordida]
MSATNNKTDSNTNKNNNRSNKPEIQRYSVAKGKYSSKLNNDRPTSGNSKNFNSYYNNNNNNNQYYYNEPSYYDNDYQQKPQRKPPKKKPIEPEVKIDGASSNIKDATSSSETETDLDKRIESMTFENQKLTEQKTSETRAGLIFLNNKESQDDTNEIDSSPRQFYNQTRKQQQNKKPIRSNQPQSITQSLRGLTNVTRTLYDPNAPTPKTPPIQQLTTVKVPPNPPSQPPLPPPPLSTSTQQQMQEFYQHQFFNHELWNQTYGNTIQNDASLQAAQALQMRKQAFNYWLTQIHNLEKSLSIYLNNSPHMDVNFRRMMEAKITLQQAYIHAMMTDMELSLSKNLDAQLWKSCFHNVIERFREYDKQLTDNNNVKKCIETVIEDGERFFLAFIRQLESAFHIDTQLYFNPNVYSPELNTIVAKYALLCTQHCFLNLGDLARYKETNRNGTDYSEARKYYFRARLLYPKNGKSCKQLAILAVMTHRRLDAIYYYVRALATTTLNDSVKQNLVSLFEEARRRLETFEKELKEREKKNERKIRAGNQKLEIWKRTDGTVVGRSLDDGQSTNNQNDFDGCVSQQELIHWFILNYITLHGKLYTKTGMETYTELCSRMLRQFQYLLRHDPCVFGKQQLVQMMAINMYQIEVAKQVNVSVDIVVRSQYEESSLQLALDMFGLLTEQTAIILERHLKTRSTINNSETPSPPPPIFNSWLRHVFPSLKIFTDWMTCNANSFIPLPDQLPAEFGPHPDILISLAKVINLIRTIDRTYIQLGSNLTNSVPVILEEDIELSGFYPLLTLPADTLQTISDTPLDEAKDSKRIVRLCFFADYLCGLKQPVFIYDVQQKTYHPALKSSIHSERSKSPTNDNQNLSMDHEYNSNEPVSPLSNSNNIDQSSTDSIVNGIDMKELKRKKRQLEHQLAEKQKQEQVVKDILNTSRLIEIEVIPRFIVLDTNCFVNYLPIIYKLIKQGRFIIIIPLIVICELDKLSVTTIVDDDSYEHAEMVRRQSIQAVKMIEECFASKERRVQAMTGEGTVLDSIQFRNEVKKHESNDDTILGCCLKYCHDNPREFFPANKDGAIRLHREVVLITDDRNLRLKAQARNVPVKDLMKFLELAQVTL